MRILVDAHVSKLIVDFLRHEGCDVLEASKLPPKAPDEVLLARATGEGRIVLTADKDFGQWVFNQGAAAKGVILLRLTGANEAARLAKLRAVWGRISKVAHGHFVVVTDRSVRRRPLP